MPTTSLTASELGHLRDEAVSWHTDTCDVFRPTDTTDQYGGKGSGGAETQIYAGLKCTIQSGIRHFQSLALEGLERFRHEYVLYFPAHTDIKLNDRLVVTSQDGAQVNLHLRVQAVLGPETEEIERMIVANITGETVAADQPGESI